MKFMCIFSVKLCSFEILINIVLTISIGSIKPLANLPVILLAKG